MAHCRLQLLATFLVALPSLGVAGPSAETLSLNSSAAFAALQIQSLGRFVPAPRPPVQPISFSAPSQTIDLAPLHNRSLRAGLNARLGGKDVWLSGLFDRGTYDRSKKVYVDPNAYISLLIEGETAVRVFNVMELLSRPQTVAIGTGQFKIKVLPNFPQIDSEIVVINLADNHKDRISLRDLIGAVGSAGVALTVEGRAYKLFYYDEVKDGRMEPGSRLFALMTAGGEVRPPIIIPEEQVPSGKPSAFTTLEGGALGLQLADGKLLVFANP